MSSYENYNAVSKSYDDQREAMGSDVIAGMMQFYCGKPLSELHVLDAGCGTGNYARALIDYGVGSVALLDASPGMLEKAREKLADVMETGKVKGIIEAKLPTMPYPDATFDAVMFNLVFHHIDTDLNGTFPNTLKSLKEARRILKPNGIVVITTIYASELVRNVWYCQLLPSFTERYSKLFTSPEQWLQIFDSSGLECIQRMNVIGTTKFDLIKDYFNWEGPLDANWRKAASFWAFATEEEIAAMQQKIVDLRERGELETWCKEHDHVNTSGIIAMLIARAK